MAIYYLASDLDPDRGAALERKLKPAIADLVSIKRIEDIPSSPQHGAANKAYVLLTAFKGGRPLDQLLELIQAHRDRLFFIIVSEEISASDYKRLIRTGSADWAAASAVPQEVLEIISRRRNANPEASGRERPAIVSFLPCAGGVGNTTLAVETAVGLTTEKAATKRSICLVDLDFQNSHVCDHLDIEPRLAIEEISSYPERLDEQLFDIFISRHASGLHVFSAPRGRFDVCALNVAALDMLFSMMSTRYELIVIDFPATWFSWTSQIISGSDGIVVTAVNTIPALRSLAKTVAAVHELQRPAGRLAIAVNRCELGLMGRVMRRHHVEKVVGRDTVFYVREDATVMQCVNTGTPMALAYPSRKSAREIAAIGAFCDGLKSLARVAS